MCSGCEVEMQVLSANYTASWHNLVQLWLNMFNHAIPFTPPPLSPFHLPHPPSHSPALHTYLFVIGWGCSWTPRTVVKQRRIASLLQRSSRGKCLVRSALSRGSRIAFCNMFRGVLSSTASRFAGGAAVAAATAPDVSLARSLQPPPVLPGMKVSSALSPLFTLLPVQFCDC